MESAAIRVYEANQSDNSGSGSTTTLTLDEPIQNHAQFTTNNLPHGDLRHAAALQLTERWGMTKLKALVDMPWSFTNSASHTKVSNIYERLIGQPTVSGFAKLVCSYNPSTNLSSGRLYGPGFQGVPGFVRRLCAPASYRDVDIENCCPGLCVKPSANGS